MVLIIFDGPGDFTLSDLAGGAGLLGLAGTVGRQQCCSYTLSGI